MSHVSALNLFCSVWHDWLDMFDDKCVKNYVLKTAPEFIKIVSGLVAHMYVYITIEICTRFQN